MSHQSLLSYMSSLQLFPLKCHLDRISEGPKKSDAGGKGRMGYHWQETESSLMSVS